MWTNSLKLSVEINRITIDKVIYQRHVGRFMYLEHTRLDLAYSFSCGKSIYNPGEKHMDAIMRIFKYLKSFPTKGIFFKKYTYPLVINVYTNV